MVLRRSSANLRHLVWAFALGGALVLPIGASYLPALNLPMPTPFVELAWSADAAVAERLSQTRISAESATGLPVRVVGRDVEIGNVPTAVSAGAAALAHASVVSAEADSPVVVATEAGPGVDQSAPSRTGGAWSWQRLLVGLWMVGVVALLLRIGVGIAATRRIGQRAERPRDGEWTRLAAELAHRIGLTRPVRILSSGQTSVPMTWGWARPVVLVPEVGASWSLARKRVVLLHELHHVKRHDCASQLVAHVACAVYWFNPLVWLAVRALRVERERACDEAVVRDGTQASSYADHLLEIARGQRRARWSSLAAVAMARRSQLEGRLPSILDAGRRGRPSRRAALALGTVMAGVILMLTAVTPTTRAAAPAEAGVLTTLAATTTEVSLGVPVTFAPADPRPQAVEQTAAPVSPQTPAADAEARARAQDAAAVPAAEANTEALQRRVGDEQARRVLELEREALALAGASQDPARREQVERVELDVRELYERIEQLRVSTGGAVEEGRAQRDVGRGLERALELYQGAVGRTLEEAYYGVQIAEEVRERVEVVQGLVLADRRPLDPRVAELLMQSLTDQDAEVRERAAWGLGRNRVEAAVGPLSTALGDENPEVRERTAWALGMIRADTAVGPLAEALSDVEPDVAERAAWALGMIRSDTAVNPLVGALDAAGPAVREQAAQALGMIRSPSAVPGLGAALDDSEVAVRVEVVEALGRIRDTAALRPLVDALRDSEARVRREAAEALGLLVRALLQRNGEERAYAEGFGIGVTEALVGRLGDAEPSVVEHAADALGLIRDARAVEGLVGALQHEDPDVVEAAADALGRIRSEEAVDGLIAALRTAEDELAEEIVEALSRIGGDRALEALIEVTEAASPAVRKAVIEALSSGRRRSRDGGLSGVPAGRPAPFANPSPNPRPR